jgi:hypothetical protein
MVGRPQVTSSDAVGAPPPSSEDIPSHVAILGAASQGTLAARYRVDAAPILTDYAAGPLARSARHIIANAKLPLTTIRCEASNPGEYDTINITSVLGTCVPSVDAAEEPRDEYEAYWLIKDGGAVETTGITYYESNDGGRTLSGLKKLGVATSLTLATEGVKVNLDPPEAEYIAYVTDLRAETIDHFALTAGSVHGLADGGPYTIDGAPATVTDANAVLIQLLTVAGLHVVKTAGSVHGAADSTAAAALTAALALAVPGEQQTYRAAALAYKAAMFGTGTANSGHTIRISPAVHGAVDETNLITAPVPPTGTLLAGDIIRVQTFAPYPSTDDLAAAFAVLAASNITPGIVLLPGRTPASYGPTITIGLDALKANGKPCFCVIQGRRAVGAESQQELRDALETEWDDTDKRLGIVATDALCTLTEGTTTKAVAKTRFTGHASNYMVRRLINPFYETTWKTTPAYEGVTLVDGNGDLVGHDEPENVPTRLQLIYRVPDSNTGRPTVLSIDYCLAGPEDQQTAMRANLVRDEIERVTNSWAWRQVGVIENVTLTSTTTGKLKPSAQQALQRGLAAELASRSGLANGISDIDATDLVTINPVVAVSGDLYYLAVTVQWTIKLATARVSSTLAARVGS